MKTTAHQRHAAHCRHARSSDAKQTYWHELSERFKNSPLATQPTAFASSERAAARRHSTRFCLKESTLHTWLREWKASVLPLIHPAHS